MGRVTYLLSNEKANTTMHRELRATLADMAAPINDKKAFTVTVTRTPEGPEIGSPDVNWSWTFGEGRFGDVADLYAEVVRTMKEYVKAETVEAENVTTFKIPLEDN